jgi:hypothetical protein
MAGVKAYGKLTTDCDDLFTKGFVNNYLASVSVTSKTSDIEWKARGCQGYDKARPD